MEPNGVNWAWVLFSSFPSWVWKPWNKRFGGKLWERMNCCWVEENVKMRREKIDSWEKKKEVLSLILEINESNGWESSLTIECEVLWKESWKMTKIWLDLSRRRRGVIFRCNRVFSVVCHRCNDSSQRGTLYLCVSGAATVSIMLQRPRGSFFLKLSLFLMSFYLLIITPASQDSHATLTFRNTKIRGRIRSSDPRWGNFYLILIAFSPRTN